MLSENDIKEELSYAYVHAVAARAGFSCELIRKDRDSVDLHVCARGQLDPESSVSSPAIALQVKASVIDPLPDGSFDFRLTMKNYDDLRRRSLVPRILVVLAMPSDPADWLRLSEDELVLKRCAYYPCSARPTPRTKSTRRSAFSGTSSSPARRSGTFWRGSHGKRRSGMARELKLSEVTRLGAPDVKRYLLARGWERAASRVADVGIFRRSGEDAAEILLPLSLDFVDLHEALARAVEEIARFEQRSANQVLRDLLRPRSDILRFGVESFDTEDGGIGLDDGLALLSGSKKALLAAACSVKRPQRFHPRMTLREAEAFVRACRLGQTERGSFVATLECAVDTDDERPSEPRPQGEDFEPFGRKATVLLVQSVARVVDAILADDIGGLMAPPLGAPVVSANLCEALVEMMPAQEGSGLWLGSSWSPFVTAPRNVPSVVRVEGQYRRAVEEVARALRPSTSPPPDLYVGKVDALQGEPGADGQMQGEVVLAAQVEDTVLRMRVELGPTDYAVAGRAHLAGEFVSVRGVLRRGPRIHRLDEPSGFTVVGR